MHRSALIGFLMCVAITIGCVGELKMNQYAMYPTAPKCAVVPGNAADSFSIVAVNDNREVYRGRCGSSRLWDAAGERVRIADFSSVTLAGSYRFLCDGVEPVSVAIVPGAANALVKASLKAFYYNRCSTALPHRFAGIFARRGGHPDTAVIIHPSAADSLRPAGSVINSPGGWYDAGDYNKYSVNAAVATSLLFTAYEAFSDYFDTLRCDIPESQNSLPDLLDEALFNLKWLQTMQDPHDGGVYHKLTTASFCGMVMPEQDKAPRFVVYKSTAAALDFAAVFAQASRIFRRFPTVLPGFADSCLHASHRAWEWATIHPKCYYFNRLTTDPVISTGEYTDTVVSDEWVWAAVERTIATNDNRYLAGVVSEKNVVTPSGIPTWRDLGIWPFVSAALGADTLQTVLKKRALAVILQAADEVIGSQAGNPYRVAVEPGDFFWGSNSFLATKGIVCAVAWNLTGDTSYRTAAAHQFDYLLGRNPTGYSFITGFGTRSAQHIHHRVSEADTIAAPVPGFLVGGPNAGQQDSKHCDCYTSKLPARSYCDATCSYASNEVAINWNAPLVFLSAAMEVMFAER